MSYYRFSVSIMYLKSCSTEPTMSLESCLVAQDIRDWIVNGRITNTPVDESRIQPGSFEPRLSGEMFVLDTETTGIFRSRPDETVYRTLLQLPGRQRQRVDITNGAELKRGFTYLIPLEERVQVGGNEFVRSSPKSSLGRLFLNTRLIADYNPCFDEMNAHYRRDVPLQLWLLIQPPAFNVIVYPELTLNQLRFFTGQDAELTPSQVREECRRNPLLYRKEGEELVPVEHIITDRLQIHLSLSGEHTYGVVGLKARHNPTPIDLRKKGEYDAEHFFEPVLKKNGGMTIHPGEHYLLASKEVLKFPPHVCAELERFSQIGLNASLDQAGFIDQRFVGDLVFEPSSTELAGMLLVDGMPISKLKLFCTKQPYKLYGPEIGSNYQLQVGPRPAKYFKGFDFAFAARNYEKLDKQVLVNDAKFFNRYRRNREGFERMTAGQTKGLLSDIRKGFFQSRYDCEFDELVLQPIPYVVLFGPDHTVFSYVRASDIRNYGDQRLFGKHSIGLGGHVLPSDEPDYIRNCLQRELEEEVAISGEASEPRFVGTLMAYDREVDRVHFGLIHVVQVQGTVSPKESSMKSGRLMPVREVMNDADYARKYETWSRILIPHLAELGQR